MATGDYVQSAQESMMERELEKQDKKIQSLQSQLEQYKAWYLESKLRYNNLDGHNLNLQSQLAGANKKIEEWKHRAIGGTCKILSLGEKCNCSLCFRDNIIYDLHKNLSRAEALLVRIRDHKDVREGISQSIIYRWPDRYERGLVSGHRCCAAIASEYWEKGESPKQDTCKWNEIGEDGMWETACGKGWIFNTDGPKENGMNFCYNCGKPVEVEGGGDSDKERD